MHEGHFTEQIVESIIAQLKDHPDCRVKSVTVRIGDVFHLVPESVQMHFNMETNGTILQGAVLNLEEVPMVVECLKCSKKGPVEDHHMPLCTFCHSQQVKVIAGDQINIEQINYMP